MLLLYSHEYEAHNVNRSISAGTYSKFYDCVMTVSLKNENMDANFIRNARIKS